MNEFLTGEGSMESIRNSRMKSALRTVAVVIAVMSFVAAVPNEASAATLSGRVVFSVSGSTDLSSPSRLSRATLSGTVYPFLDGASDAIQKVDYYVDDPLGDGTPISVTTAPFSLAATGLNTTGMKAGTHIILAVVTTTSGTTLDLFARFQVKGTGVAAPTAMDLPAAPAATAPAPSTATAPAATATTSNSLRFYAADSFWNVAIPAGAALDPNSAAMVQATLVAEDTKQIANGDYGTPLYYSTSKDPMGTFTCTQYCDQGKTYQFNVPAGLKPSAGSDGHMSIINKDTGDELDLWLAKGSGTSWSANIVVKTSSKGWGALCASGQKCMSANAAGFAQMGGLIRPEEVKAGVIDHALAINFPRTRSGMQACPATHNDGKVAGNDAIPEGARIRLDPSVNIAGQSWKPWEKAVATAMQKYGAYVTDTAGALTLRGQTNGDWESVGMGTDPSIDFMPWEKMQVLAIKDCGDTG